MSFEGPMRSSVNGYAKKIQRFAKVGRLAALATLLTAAPLVAMAQDSVKLKFAHVLPATHYLWEQGAKAFTETITAASDGEITFEVYPAAQLGRDNVANLNSGIADFALLIPSYTPDALPLSSVGELPGLYSDSCEATAKYWEVAKPGGILYESEFKPLGLHPVFVTVLIPYRILTAEKEVVTMDDMTGLKIRANGAAMDKTVRKLGGVPVRLSSPELFDAVSRGTVDGVLFTLNPVKQYGLDTVLNYMVEGPQLGSATVVYAISDRVWEGLSDEMKVTFMEAGATAQQSLCAWMDNDELRVRNDLVSSGAVKVTTLTDEQIAEWGDRVSSVADEWASELDAVGRNGSEILEAFRNAPGN